LAWIVPASRGCRSGTQSVSTPAWWGASTPPRLGAPRSATSAPTAAKRKDPALLPDAFLLMTAQLAVVGRRFSEPVTSAHDRPLDLSDFTLPRSPDTPDGERLLAALERAVRDMRIRQRSTPMDTDAALRLGIVLPDRVETADLDLQRTDFRLAADQQTVIDAARALEQRLLSS